MGTTEDPGPSQPRSVADRIRAAAGPSAGAAERRPTGAASGASAVERALGSGGATTADRLAALKREAESRRSELDADLDELRGGAEAVARGASADAVVATAETAETVVATESALPVGPPVPDAPEDYPQPPAPPAEPAPSAPSPYGYPPASGPQVPSGYRPGAPSPAGYGPGTPTPAVHGAGAPPYGAPSAPGYGQPVPGGHRPGVVAPRPTPGPPSTTKPSSGSSTAAFALAVASIIFGVSGFFGVILAVISLRVGHGARKEARSTGRPVPAMLTGATVLAIIGLVVSILAFIGQLSS